MSVSSWSLQVPGSSEGLTRFLPCQPSAHYAQGSCMLDWRQCGHGLSSQPRESCDIQVIKPLLDLFGYPERAATELYSGTFKAPLRRLCAWQRHVRTAVQLALAENLHHSANKVETHNALRGQNKRAGREEVEYVKHAGLRAQKTPLGGSCRSPGRRGATAPCGAPEGRHPSSPLTHLLLLPPLPHHNHHHKR